VITSPEVQRVVTSAAAALEGADTLVATANRRLATLGPVVEEAARHFDETLGEVRALVGQLDRQTVPVATEALQNFRSLARRIDAETVPAANLFLGDLDRLARRVDGETLPAAHQMLAEVRQAAASFDRTAEAGRLALDQVRKLAADADEAIDGESPLRYQLDLTLREMAAAARAFRMLASYLEHHPDAIVFGKSGK
jgi:hypothetical protein